MNGRRAAVCSRVAHDGKDVHGLWPAIDLERSLQTELSRRRIADERQLRAEEWRQDARVQPAPAHCDQRHSRSDGGEHARVVRERLRRHRDLGVCAAERAHLARQRVEIGHRLEVVMRQHDAIVSRAGIASEFDVDEVDPRAVRCREVGRSAAAVGDDHRLRRRRTQSRVGVSFSRHTKRIDPHFHHVVPRTDGADRLDGAIRRRFMDSDHQFHRQQKTPSRDREEVEGKPKLDARPFTSRCSTSSSCARSWCGRLA